MKVIVAGAGLAGLTAARALSRERADVTIVDARPRAGGRVWTLRDGLAGGQHAELGGEFIDGDQDDIRRLCAELSLPLVRVLRGGFTHRFRGEDGEPHVSRTRPWTELEALMAPLIRRYRAAREDPVSESVRELATHSIRDWLRERGASREQHAMADALRGFFLADPEELSVLPLVAQLARGGSPAQAEMYRVVGGADRLIEALTKDSGARLLLGHRITALAQTAERVTVTAIDAQGHQQQLDADVVVMTMPAPALACISITPPLWEEQWRAVRTLKYGCATKVIVQLTRPPFRSRARAFATDTPLGAFWDATEGQVDAAAPGGRGGLHVLTFLAGGAASRTLRARADRGAPAILSDLCWLGLARAPVEGFRVVTWEDDPYARGGYAYLDPTFDPALLPQLARRAGRIVFAGEHTSDRWQGYMNGAVESGLRAARQVGERSTTKITS